MVTYCTSFRKPQFVTAWRRKAVPFEVLDKIIYIPDTGSRASLLLRLLESLLAYLDFKKVDIIQITQTVELQIVFFFLAQMLLDVSILQF